MATSGQITGKDAFLQIEDSAGTLRTVSGDINNSSFPLASDTPENTAYGDTYHSFQTGGLKTAEFNLDGWFNDTATTGIETVLSGIGTGGATQIVWGAAGSTSGYRKTSACMTLVSYDITSPVADMIGITGNFVMRSGSVTLATF